MIYDRPVTELMLDAARELRPPIRVGDVVAWFAANYPKIKPSTVTAHIKGMTSNDPSRHHYPTAASRPPLFFRVSSGVLEPYDPDRHMGEGSEAPGDDADIEVPDEIAQFALERQLEEFLLGNWNLIDWGRPLQIWRGPDGTLGHQLDTSIAGRLDFLCVDAANDALVVVELKRGRSSDRVVGQAARYMGWVRHHIAKPGQAVEGIVVAHEFDEGLKYAATSVPGLTVFAYEVAFSLHPIESPHLPSPRE